MIQLVTDLDTTNVSAFQHRLAALPWNERKIFTVVADDFIQGQIGECSKIAKLACTFKSQLVIAYISSIVLKERERSFVNLPRSKLPSSSSLFPKYQTLLRKESSLSWLLNWRSWCIPSSSMGLSCTIRDWSRGNVPNSFKLILSSCSFVRISDSPIILNFLRLTPCYLSCSSFKSGQEVHILSRCSWWNISPSRASDSSFFCWYISSIMSLSKALHLMWRKVSLGGSYLKNFWIAGLVAVVILGRATPSFVSCRIDVMIERQSTNLLAFKFLHSTLSCYCTEVQLVKDW